MDNSTFSYRLRFAWVQWLIVAKATVSRFVSLELLILIYTALYSTFGYGVWPKDLTTLPFDVVPGLSSNTEARGSRPSIGNAYTVNEVLSED